MTLGDRKKVAEQYKNCIFILTAQNKNVQYASVLG